MAVIEGDGVFESIPDPRFTGAATNSACLGKEWASFPLSEIGSPAPDFVVWVMPLIKFAVVRSVSYGMGLP